MAIRLHIQENRVRLSVGQGSAVRLKASEGIPVYADAYTGTTEVTPTQETQTLATNGKTVFADIIVKPIPQNYGLITYNGTTITVS